MRGHWKRLACAAALLLCVAGCAQWNKSRTSPMSEPPLEGVAVDDTSVPGHAGASPPRVGFVDRHPLFSKPRAVYQNTNQPPVTKAAAATVVGIPLGVVGEVGQIIGGRPPASY